MLRGCGDTDRLNLHAFTDAVEPYGEASSRWKQAINVADVIGVGHWSGLVSLVDGMLSDFPSCRCSSVEGQVIFKGQSTRDLSVERRRM